MADPDAGSSDWESDDSSGSSDESLPSDDSRRHRSEDDESNDDESSSSSSSDVRAAFRRRPQQAPAAPVLRKRLSDPSLPRLAMEPSDAAAAALIRPTASSDDERAKRRQHHWRRRCRLWLRRATGPPRLGDRQRPRHRWDDVLSACGTLILGTSCLVWVLLVLLPGEAVLYGSGPGRMTTGTRGAAGDRHGGGVRHPRPRHPPSHDRGPPPPPAARGTVKRFVRGMAEHIVHRLERRARRQRADREGQALHGVEALRPGCARADWQLRPHPTLEPHEVDLPAILVGRHDVHVAVESGGADRAAYPPPGYLANGLWRSVWVVYPRDAATPTVLKMMKPEHKVDRRNLERHARDAIVMDRLTSSPYVTDIYGFVGNSVLSEYIHESLDVVLYESSSSRNTLYNETTHPTRHTPVGRLQLALDVARGVEALHTVEGGPVVHADLQAKQFLVTRDGTVKVNDFNRCRFMAHRNDTHRPCAFRIPSAPGKARAPEEYAYGELNEKLDIYSTGHILYGILSGSDPWYGWSSSEVKRLVQEGYRPLVPDKYRAAASTDEALHNLTLRAYELDPAQRINATELVREIQMLLTTKTGASIGA